MNGVNAYGYLPFWKQGGEKIFSFIKDNTGFIIDDDGANPSIIKGIEAESIAFSSDEKTAVFAGVDHNIYTVDLKDDLQIKRKLTTINNNEWYGVELGASYDIETPVAGLIATPFATVNIADEYSAVEVGVKATYKVSDQLSVGAKASYNTNDFDGTSFDVDNEWIIGAGASFKF